MSKNNSYIYPILLRNRYLCPNKMPFQGLRGGFGVNKRPGGILKPDGTLQNYIDHKN